MYGVDEGDPLKGFSGDLHDTFPIASDGEVAAALLDVCALFCDVGKAHGAVSFPREFVAPPPLRVAWWDCCRRHCLFVDFEGFLNPPIQVCGKIADLVDVTAIDKAEHVCEYVHEFFRAHAHPFLEDFFGDVRDLMGNCVAQCSLPS